MHTHTHSCKDVKEIDLEHLLFYFETVYSLCTPCWPGGAYYVDKAGLTLIEICLLLPSSGWD